MLKAKEREMECLLNKLSEKDELLRKYCTQVEELKKDNKNKCKKYQEVLKQLKAAQKEGNKPCEDEENPCDSEDLAELVNAIIKNVEDQRKSVTYQLQSAECQVKTLAAEKKMYLKERNEITSQLQCLVSEKERLLKELTSQRKADFEREECVKTIDALKSEKNELLEKINTLHESIQDINNNFKETRWALTSEVAEKHDQVQELKRCVGVLEEQLRQADMQTHFKDDIIKELRKELKASRKSERLGLYDVVNELRERKNKCLSNVKFQKQSEMSKHQSGVTYSSGFCSGTSVADKQDRNDDKKNANESEKLLAQIECLKQNLRGKVDELKCQEEFTRNLEDELAKTKMDLCVLERYQRQERLNKSGKSTVSESVLNRHHAILVGSANKIEDILRNLSEKQSPEEISKANLEKEVEKIRCVKKDLERSRSKNEVNNFSDNCGNKKIEELKLCTNAGVKGADSEPLSQCNLVHIADVEKFREKAITGAVALEQMKEQIGILENLIKKYIEEFPCECDKTVVGNCEDKLVKLRTEFDEVTFQLCEMLQKFNKSTAGESYDSLDGTINSKETMYSSEQVSKLKSEYQKIQKEICDKENAAEKLKRMSRQLDEEIQHKRTQLVEYTKELESKICEIFKLRELIRKVCRRLKEIHCDQTMALDEDTGLSSNRNSPNLFGLFCDIQEFWSILEKSMPALFDLPKQLREDNEKLKEKLGYLEKCACNKEETLRFLQDTVKLRECQIEELKSKMETSECQSSKLAQDVEEKCRLIANLQEAVRKCKQFEGNLELLESLRFEYCDLECKLEEYEKEILSKDQKMERLHNEITNLSYKNFLLTEKLKILDPKLKILYKTSHLFEKTVNELQEELNSKECEIDTLYGKVRELEVELETEFKKCENRAAEDSKCIEELSITVKSFQNELYCAQENYNMSLIERENILKQEMQARESELNNTICQLKAELQKLQRQAEEVPSQGENSKNPDFESMLTQAESQQQIYEKRIRELQKALECIALEHEEERKNILQKLCDEKKENFKNKNLITKLNESIKRKVQNEKTFKECMDRLTGEMENLKVENHELKTEVEARKKIMCAMERDDGGNLTELEELICSLKIQKADLKARCCNLKAELEKEGKLKRVLECRVDDLNSMLQSKMQKFNEMVENYKCTSSRLQQTYETMKEIEESLIFSQNNIRRNAGNDEDAECSCLKKVLDIKTAENAKLICQVQVLKVEIESLQSENAALEASKDAVISRLRDEIECLENGLDDFQTKCKKLNEENKTLLKELEGWTDKGAAMQNEFRERQKDLCGKLRTTISEKNDLLNSMDELQKQLEQICLDNVNKEKINRELSEKCSRLKINKDSNDSYLRNKTDKIICNLSKEVKNLHHELSGAKENFSVLNEEYQALLEQFKCCEKKKCNLEKLYTEVNNENKKLLESKVNFERELCELQAQNLLLKDKLVSKGEGTKNTDEKKKLCEKIRELTVKIKTLEKKVIPELEQEIADKICCIENLNMELREANMSSQRMRNEALRVIEHTRKYLAAQRYANETLKTRLECSNKRGNMLGIENRELEEQLKAVTRMNEFLLCQLESGKSDAGEVEPRSFSPLPWGCSVVERDTSSSEYLAESGFQSMQPSPIIMDYDHESQFDSKRNCPQWNSLKKNKCGESVEFTSYRNGTR